MAPVPKVTLGGVLLLTGIGVVAWALAALSMVRADPINSGHVFLALFLFLIGAPFIFLGLGPVLLPDRNKHLRGPQSAAIPIVEILPTDTGEYILDSGEPGDSRTVPSVLGRKLLVARPDSIPHIRADARVWSRVINAEDIPQFTGDFSDTVRVPQTLDVLMAKLRAAEANDLAIVACPMPAQFLGMVRMLGLERQPPEIAREPEA